MVHHLVWETKQKKKKFKTDKAGEQRQQEQWAGAWPAWGRGDHGGNDTKAETWDLRRDYSGKAQEAEATKVEEQGGDTVFANAWKE